MKNINPSTGYKMVFRWSWREIWSGQLWPVTAALTLIVACVVALSALAVRVEKVMTDQGRSMMAADLVFHSANPVPQLLLSDAQDLELSVSRQIRFQTMAFSDNNMQLVSAKAVQSSYPLRGDLVLTGAAGLQKSSVQPGELWLAERLFSLLDVKVGDIVAVGDADLQVSGRIEAQPELAYNPFRTMPSVFIHYSDLDKTGAVQLGSRVQYRIFFNGENDALTQLQQDHQAQTGDSWISEKNQGRSADLIIKAKQYLSLTILMVILMASVTLVLTCRHYAASRAESVAMLKSMGAGRSWLRSWLFSQAAIMFLCSLFFGSLFGIALELLLRLPLQGILPDVLPGYGWKPFAFGCSVSLLIGLPALGIPLLRLLDTPAIAVLQKQAGKASKKHWWLASAPAAAFLLFYGGSALVWMVCLGLILLFLVLAGISYALLHLLSRGKWGAAMKLALSRIKRSPQTSMMQLAALSGSLMLLAVIWLVRADLLGDWQQTLPPDAANVFAINIAPEEQQQYLQELDNNSIERSDAYPIIRGRLTHINDLNAKDKAAENDPDVHALRREINFTWAEKLPVYNDITAGKWTPKNSVSIEATLAADLGVSVGDKLSFSVNSQLFSARVNSIRSVQWQSMKPNFYFIFSKDMIEQMPATWLVSFRIDEKQIPVLNQLARDYPTVTLLDFRTMGEKIQSMLVQITWSLSVLGGLGVISGILLIFTLLRLSLKQRQNEITLYRTLGASRKSISQTLWSEYGVMAAAAGAAAVAGAEALLFSLVKWGFQLQPSIHIGMWFALPALAVVIVFISLKSVIQQLLKPLK
ncbi:ABC transporter permease [Psychromonas ossibalaenae]|uniref:ABC transporter permease n=1 Tax=Psychromonas ossibalaenae TaxID=444922 RepID=UPI00035C8568|nr:FtsX-like permease family protein [Psychromonas ossibalaenae]